MTDRVASEVMLTMSDEPTYAQATTTDMAAQQVKRMQHIESTIHDALTNSAGEDLSMDVAHVSLFVCVMQNRTAKTTRGKILSLRGSYRAIFAARQS